MLLLASSQGNNPDYGDPHVFYIVLAAILITFFVMSAVIIFVHFNNQRVIKRLRKFNNEEITAEECDLLINYRKLNCNGKSIINDTLATLIENEPTQPSTANQTKE